MTFASIIQVILACAVPLLFVLFILEFVRERWYGMQANGWPEVEGRIENSTFLELSDEMVTVRVPSFSFSYEVDGRRYGGNFQLHPYATDPFYNNPDFMNQMIGRKLKIHFRPGKPATWFIADEYMEGCKVSQDSKKVFLERVQ